MSEGDKAEVGDTKGATMLPRVTQDAVEGYSLHKAVRWSTNAQQTVERPEFYSTGYWVRCSNGPEQAF